MSDYVSPRLQAMYDTRRNLPTALGVYAAHCRKPEQDRICNRLFRTMNRLHRLVTEEACCRELLRIANA